MTVWLEVIGWVGSAVLVLSLAQARVLRFRLLNLVASVVLTGYNAALGVWPMVAMNAVIAVLDAYHLVRLLRSRDDEATYEVVRVRPDDEYLGHVLASHAADIDKHNPGWVAEPAGRSAFLVVRETETVGVVLVRDEGEGEGRVELDYVLPRFRDFSVGKFVYRHGGRLTGQGLRRLVADTRMPDQDHYFPRVGFAPDATGRLVLELAA
ncbi:hypothetical protein GCM10028777_24510 [Angustibacter speluncae]